MGLRRFARLGLALGASLQLACGKGKDAPNPKSATQAASPERAASESVEARPPRAPALVDLVVDQAGGCVRTDAGAIACWGPAFLDDRGRTASSSEWRRARLVDLGQGEAKAVDIALASGVLCALFDDHQLRCLDSLARPPLRTRPVAEGADALWMGGPRDQAWTCVGVGSELRCTPGPELSDVVDLAIGESAGCALHGDASMTCWKPGEDPVRTPLSYSGAEPSSVEAVEIELGEPRCVRTKAGALWCERHRSGLEFSSIDLEPYLFEVETSAPVIELDQSSLHMCRLDPDGAAWCRGANGLAQLGQGHSRSNGDGIELDWKRVPLPGPAKQLAVSSSQSCALTAKGVWCWGTQDAQLGARLDEVARVELSAVRLHADRSLSCASTNEGELWCWGTTRPLGENCCGGIVQASEPQVTTAARSVVDDYADGMLLSKGELVRGRLLRHLDNHDFEIDWRVRGVHAFAGNGDETCLIRGPRRSLECWSALTPHWHDRAMSRMARPEPVRDLRALSVDDSALCIAVGGRVRCWSWGSYDFDGGPWVEVPGISAAVELVEHGLGGCARLEGGGVSCWIDDDGEYERFDLGVEDAAELAFGSSLGLCLRTSSGAVRCAEAMLGPDSPWTTVIASGAVEIAAGSGHFCARIDDDDGVSERIECRGENRKGQLGKLGDHVMSKPTQIEVLTDRPR